MSSEARRLEAMWRGEIGDYFARRPEDESGRRPLWVDVLAVLPVRSVLEVGCSRGQNLAHLAELVPGVQGCDLNHQAVRQARHVAPVTECLARALPYRAASFDLVLTVGVLMHHADDVLEDAIAELARITRRWVLCGEYAGDGPRDWRGHRAAIADRDYAPHFAAAAPDLHLVSVGRIHPDPRWSKVTAWLYER